MSSFIGQITTVAFGHVPYGWVLCNGQLLSVSTNKALFALIGTTYGGDGKTHFAVPNLSGRIPIGVGTNNGINYERGSKGGVETISLNANQMPAHTHTFNTLDSSNNPVIKAQLNAIQNPATSQSTPQNNLLSVDNFGSAAIYAPANSGAIVPMAKEAVTISITPGANPIENTGKGYAIDIRQPYLAVNFIICVIGEFPVKSN